MSSLLLLLSIIGYSMISIFLGVSKADNEIITCTAGQDCVMTCGYRECQSDYIQCPDDYTCTIECNGHESCWGAVVDATHSSSLTMTCAGSGEFRCENIDIFCPPNINGVKQCHISGTSNGLRGCSSCGGEYLDNDNSLNFYGRNGWLDIDLSGYTAGSNGYGWKGGKMHCLDDYNTNACSISSTAWTCSDSAHVCNMATNMPTTASPTQSTIAPTTVSPTTNMPTTFTPTTFTPTTISPTTTNPTSFPTTSVPTTFAPTTHIPTTNIPSTSMPTTSVPSTLSPSTWNPTTSVPTTFQPTGDDVIITIPDVSKSTLSVPTSSVNDGEIGVESTIELDEDDENLKKKSISFEKSPWMLISAGLVVVVICLICYIMIGIVRWRKKKQIYKDKDIQPMETEMTSNIELFNTNVQKQAEFGRVMSLSNEMMDTPIENNQFIVDGDEFMTPTFPENNGTGEFIVNGDDEIGMTPMTPQNEKFINNEQNSYNDEFIVNDNDNMMTPTFGENHVIVDQEEDEEEHIEGTDEDDNIISDINNMVTDMGNDNNVNIVTDMGNDEGDKENIMNAFTIE